MIISNQDNDSKFLVLYNNVHMIRKYTHNGVTWVDLESPTSEEVKQIMSEFNINSGTAEELLTPSLKPKVDLFKNYIYLILHFPAFKHSHVSSNKLQEVDFVIGKNFLITTKYEAVDPLRQFAKEFEVNKILNRGDEHFHAGHIFFQMIKGLYESLNDELDFVSDSLREIEENIFKGKEREMVWAISNVSRDLLNFKQATILHREILKSFEIAAKKIFGEEYSFYPKIILNEYYKISNKITGNSEYVSELRETNNSLLSTNQNEITKVITIVAFLFLPFSIITGFFQMNTSSTPLIGTESDWIIIVSLEILVSVSLFILAKVKKWL